MNIQNLKDKTDGEMIVGPGLTAKCTEVAERKTGSGQYGEWACQQLLLEDDSGKIRLMAWNHPNLKDLQGYRIKVQAHKGDNGWMGCSIEQREYKGEKFKQIKLSSSGEILIVTADAAQGKSEQTYRANNGAVEWWDYVMAMKTMHAIAMDLEPNDGVARAALVNTAMIALTQGKLKKEESEQRPPDDDIPF